MKAYLLFILSLFITIQLYSAIPENDVPFISKRIRVALLEEAKSFTIQGKNIRLYDFFNKKNILKSNKNSPLVFKYTNSSEITVNGKKIKTNHVALHAPTRKMKLNGNSYPGLLDITISGKGFLVVNHVSLDKYLASTLNREMSPSWPVESLKAQAIAARTYAIACMMQNLLLPFDLRADVRDQVYDGSYNESVRTSRAVKESEGEILHYNDKILKTYYHANSGGHTENPSLIWGGDAAYMPAVNDPHTFNQPGYKWKFKIPIKRLSHLLKRKGYVFDTLFDVEIADFTPSGRIKSLALTTESKKYFISGQEFRFLLGTTTFRSTKFMIASKNKDRIIFTGRGMGHGAGMSQWGAKTMGDKGLKHKAILKHYYPKLKVKKIW